MTEIIVIGGEIEASKNELDLYTLRHFTGDTAQERLEQTVTWAMLQNRHFFPPLCPTKMYAPAPANTIRMTDAGRKEIGDICEASDAHSFVVTHGVQDMETTARYLRFRMNEKPEENLAKKAILLTGAMKPYFEDREAAQENFWHAMTASLHARPGVWIAMNGLVLPADNAKLDNPLDPSRFDPKAPESFEPYDWRKNTVDRMVRKVFWEITHRSVN